MNHQQSSLFLELPPYRLHLRQLQPVATTLAPVLYLHGAVENGRIFYSQNGKGLACFLAEQGFIGYAADFAGRGLSQPKLAEGLQQDQQQMICRDIPALLNYVYQQHQQKVILICHSWAGVLAAASLARFPELADKVLAKVCFGTKRVISVNSLARKLKIDLCWNTLAPWLGQRYGYVPAKRWRFGADDEPTQFLRDTVRWIKGAPFVDCSDGFDYQAACQQLNWPPLWHFAAEHDQLLGHPQDVQAFMHEAAQAEGRYTLLSRANGYQHPYDHISMLTAAAAKEEHFTELVNWLVQLVTAE